MLETDASNFAIGAVLLQLQQDNLLHPVAFYSSKIIPAETNYPIYDKEMLSIVAACVKWSHLLLNTKDPFIIKTDHKALEYFRTPQNLTNNRPDGIISLFNSNFVLSILEEP